MINLPFPREALAAAAYRFQQSSGTRIQLTEFDEIMRHKLTQADPDELAQAIITTLSSDEADAAYRSSAYFALGKKADHAQLEFFRQRLRVEMDQKDRTASHQLMTALDTLDEEIFAPDREDKSPSDHALNARDAAAYLEKISEPRT